MNIQLSDHFNYKKIFKFTLSPILMMIFTSLYGIVDGFFISNYAGLDEYAGVNVIMPVIMVVGGIGFMFGAGGSALVSMYLGQHNKERANQVFTMIIKSVFYVGIIISLLGCLLITPIAKFLGSFSSSTTENMVKYAVKYGRILALGQVFFMIQNVFHSFLIVAEKPNLGFRYTLFAGLTNMVLDFILVGVLRLGVVGAAIATIIGYLVGGLFPLLYFSKQIEGTINLVKTKIEIRPILRSCYNGSSEFVGNISSSIVGFVFNIQLLRYFGQDGVSAYGTLMYTSFIFVATYIGYSIGMAPIVGYNYGAQNKKELKNVLLKSLSIISVLAILMFLAGEFIGPIFSKLYVGKNSELLALTTLAFKIFSLQFLFCGFSIYLSSFFTALNNGLISAIISFLRTLVFQIGFVLILPIMIGKEGIWWSIVLSEVVSFLLSFIFLLAKRKRYGYL